MQYDAKRQPLVAAVDSIVVPRRNEDGGRDKRPAALCDHLDSMVLARHEKWVGPSSPTSTARHIFDDFPALLP